MTPAPARHILECSVLCVICPCADLQVPTLPEGHLCVDLQVGRVVEASPLRQDLNRRPDRCGGSAGMFFVGGSYVAQYLC